MDQKNCPLCIAEDECYTSSVLLYEMLNSFFGSNTIEKSFVLPQEPSEDLSLNLKISRPCITANDKKIKYSFDLRLDFKNNLHLLCSDYSYQLVFRMKQSDFEKHISLFSVNEIREDSSIAIRGTFYLNIKESNSRILHICCNIKRFCKSKANVSKEVSLDNVGKMLLKTGLYSDVSLLVGEDIIQAHRHILMSRSKVFEAMFSHMFEKENGVVKIEDFSSNVVKEMLSYIYTGKATICSGNSHELLQIAHKYQIEDLESKCEEYLLFNVDFDNVVSILDLSLQCNLNIFNKSLLRFVNINESQMIKEPAYQKFLCRNLTIDTIVDVLKMCQTYEIPSIKEKAFQFVKANNNDLIKNEQYLNLFNEHLSLMKEIFVYLAS